MENKPFGCPNSFNHHLKPIVFVWRMCCENRHQHHILFHSAMLPFGIFQHHHPHQDDRFNSANRDRVLTRFPIASGHNSCRKESRSNLSCKLVSHASRIFQFPQHSNPRTFAIGSFVAFVPLEFWQPSYSYYTYKALIKFYPNY